MAAVGAVIVHPTNSSAGESDRLIDLARSGAPHRYESALRQGAKILPTPDGRSFYLLWLPPADASAGNPSETPPIIVTLHGHGSWAFNELALWHDHAAQHGYGVLAIQWWFGKGESPHDYYTPDELYPILETILKQQGVGPGRALLHGFSRGASNTYALTALDVAAGNRFFGLTVANSGGASENYPPNVAMTEGRFGEAPLRGSWWLLFCGGRDEHPDRDGCPAMHRTATWIEHLGGPVEPVLEDPEAGHGGFHRTPAHVESALALFARLVESL